MNRGYNGYGPNQGGYQGGYPPSQGGYPPSQGGYPPSQGGYPPSQGGYPPSQGGYGGPHGYGGPGGYGQYPHHPHGPGFNPYQGGYPGAQQPPAYGGQGYAQDPNYGQRLPDSAHEHGLMQEPSNDTCKVCQKPLAGSPAFVCHECPLRLCYDCGNAIFYGNKAKQVHPHPLALRVRNAWKCDICKQHYRGTASFYCKGCDFDACSRCYVGY